MAASTHQYQSGDIGAAVAALLALTVIVVALAANVQMGHGQLKAPAESSSTSSTSYGSFAAAFAREEGTEQMNCLGWFGRDDLGLLMRDQGMTTDEIVNANVNLIVEGGRSSGYEFSPNEVISYYVSKCGMP